MHIFLKVENHQQRRYCLRLGKRRIKEISGQGIAEGKNAYKRSQENQTLNLWNT